MLFIAAEQFVTTLTPVDFNLRHATALESFGKENIEITAIGGNGLRQRWFK